MNFWKMHGLGNDYVVIDNRDQKIDDKKASELAKQLCERRFSIGADGLLIVSNSSAADIKMQIFNSDGSQAEMCGNGIRCFSKYCFENKVVSKTEFSVETLAGIKHVWLTLADKIIKSVRVDMGKPNWDRSALPMKGQGTCINQDLEVEEGEHYNVTCLSMGNPHCVIFVEDVDEFPVEYVGPIIENHEVFPKRTNVGFAQVLNKNELKLRVWERGCGETLACGTGACAAAAAANNLRKIGNKVTIHVPGGDLQVEIAENLFLSGAAEKAFEGTF